MPNIKITDEAHNLLVEVRINNGVTICHYASQAIKEKAERESINEKKEYAAIGTPLKDKL